MNPDGTDDSAVLTFSFICTKRNSELEAGISFPKKRAGSSHKDAQPL